MSEPSQPPEAELLERLRTERRPKLSVRAAADMAGMSDARWRQIAKGFKYEAGGIRVPAHAPATTLARMAKVVGATPDQLREAGRADAAEELATLSELDGRPRTNRPPAAHRKIVWTGDSFGARTYASLTDALDAASDAVQAISREPWVTGAADKVRTVAEASIALTNLRTALTIEYLRRRDQAEVDDYRDELAHQAHIERVTEAEMQRRLDLEAEADQSDTSNVTPLRLASDEDALDEALSAEDKVARQGASDGRRLRDAQDREAEAGDPLE